MVTAMSLLVQLLMLRVRSMRVVNEVEEGKEKKRILIKENRWKSHNNTFLHIFLFVMVIIYLK